MVQFKSLQQRLALFMLLPVSLLLFAMGFIGFIYARKGLLEQWGEATVLKLQRAAHQVDMRLQAPKALLQMFNRTGAMPNARNFRDMLLESIQALEAVARVSLSWQQEGGPAVLHLHRHGRGGGSMMHFHRANITGLTPPRYDDIVEQETVSLVAEFQDESGQVLGQLEVVMRFDLLVENISTHEGYEGLKAFIVDDSGKILFSSERRYRRQLGDNGDRLEKRVMAAIQNSTYGTLLGEGLPPAEVVGFYRLTEAPWSLVVSAPGRTVLAPMLRFRDYYALTGLGFILLILLLIRGGGPAARSVPSRRFPGPPKWLPEGNTALRCR